MIDFALEHTLRPLDAEIARTTQPRHLAILNNFREHLLAELAGDVDAIMKTQCADPQYHFFGSGVGEVAATLAGVRKMPMPITRLTIIMVKSKRFSFDFDMLII